MPRTRMRHVSNELNPSGETEFVSSVADNTDLHGITEKIVNPVNVGSAVCRCIFCRKHYDKHITDSQRLKPQIRTHGMTRPHNYWEGFVYDGRQLDNVVKTCGENVHNSSGYSPSHSVLV